MYLLKLLRLPNLFILVFTIYSITKWIIYPPLVAHGITSTFTSKELYLLLFITVCIGAGGYVYNDIMDQNSDAKNNKRLIVGHSVTKKIALLYYIFLVFAPLPAVLSLDMEHGFYYFTIGYLSLVFLLWIYNILLKRTPLLGNLLVAVLCGFAVFLPYLIEARPLKILSTEDPASYHTLTIAVFCFTIFSFLSNLIREVIKDIEDMEGDVLAGYKTLPIAIGVDQTKRIILIFETLLLMALIIWLYNISVDLGTLVLISTLVLGFLSFIVFKTLMARTKLEYSRLSLFLKMYFVIGLLALFLSI